MLKSNGKSIQDGSFLTAAKLADFDKNIKFELFNNDSIGIKLSENQYTKDIKIKEFNLQIIKNDIPAELNAILRGNSINIFLNQSQVDGFFNVVPKNLNAFFQCDDYLGAFAKMNELNEKEGWGIYINNELEYRDTMVNNFQVIDAFVKIFLAIVMIVSVVNLFSAIIASITKRKKELAVLSSIGMEEKSIKKMLYLENLFVYIFALAISVIATILIAVGMKFAFKFDEFAIPIAEFAIIGAAYAVLIFVATAVAIKFVLKGNIIENIKNDND